MTLAHLSRPLRSGCLPSCAPRIVMPSPPAPPTTARAPCLALQGQGPA
jgi:hypothetical protein